MYKYRKIISIVAAVLILFGALGFGGISRAKAIEPGLYEVDGNATCSSGQSHLNYKSGKKFAIGGETT